ncbi:MAG: exopolysaccharide production protein ExoZ [Rubritepida sp.]|nr:exopolysaccharide production protein ExoZ [Rubritepida sp.]
MSSAQSREIESIQVLRGIAAALVAGGHIYAFSLLFLPPDAHSNWFTPTLGQGGVDVFFVISGAIMSIILLGKRDHGPREVGDFWVRRIFRIYPLYFITMAIGSFFTLATFTWAGAIRNLALEDFSPIFPIAWTLVFEVRFYLLVGLTMLVPARHRRAAIFLAFAFIVGAVLLGLFSHQIDRRYSDPIMLDFLLGGIAGMAIAARRMWAPAWFLGTGLAMFAGATVAFMPPAALDFATFRKIGYGLSAAFILYGLVGQEFRSGGRTRFPKPLIRLGDISFSLFLWHWVVVTGFYHYWPVMTFGVGPKAAVGYAAGSIVATLALSVLSFAIIERPMIALGRQVGAALKRVGRPEAASIPA